MIIVFLRQRIQQFSSIQADDIGYIPEDEIEMPAVVKLVHDKLELLKDILLIPPV